MSARLADVEANVRRAVGQTGKEKSSRLVQGAPHIPLGQECDEHATFPSSPVDVGRDTVDTRRSMASSGKPEENKDKSMKGRGCGRAARRGFVNYLKVCSSFGVATNHIHPISTFPRFSGGVTRSCSRVRAIDPCPLTMSFSHQSLNDSNRSNTYMSTTTRQSIIYGPARNPIP